MKIGIDVRCLSVGLPRSRSGEAGKHSGVEEYIYNLLPNLFLLGRQDQFFLFYNSFKKPIPEIIKYWSLFPNVRIIKHRWPSKMLNAALWSLKRPRIDKILGDMDVMFFPNITFFSVSKNVPYVMTFHDLSFELFPNYYNPYRRFWHFLVNPGEKARKAARIIAVSKSTAEDLNNWYEIEDKKIISTYLGLSPLFFDGLSREDILISESGNYRHIADEWRIRKRYRIPDNPFILYLGTIEPRKNLVSLIKAYDEFRKKSRLNYDLVIAGAKGWSYGEIFRAAKESSFKENIYFPGPISNTDRLAFYRMSSLFVFPSFFEGFGLPPLEALACGTPVICSASTSLLEVFGSHALLINPHDISEISWAMERALSDKNLRKTLIQKGLEYAREFRWEKTAAETLEVLHKAAQSS